MRSRHGVDDTKIIVTGTGRAGTTLLVQYFTALGFDTGYSLTTALNSTNPISHAGLEHSLVASTNPYVIKSPWFSDTLYESLENRDVVIHAAIVPVRSLFGAAESRRRVTSAGTSEGGLWYTNDPTQQESVLAQQFYKAIYSLVKFEIPIYFLEFPRFARDASYCWRALEPLIEDHGVTESEAQLAFDMVVNPEKIHDF